MQRDAAGLIVFDDEVRQFVAPSTRQGQLARLLHAVEKAEAGTRTDFASPSRTCGNFSPPRADRRDFRFLGQPGQVIKTIAPLRFHGNEVVLFHLLDPEEIRPKLQHPVLLEDLESGETLEVSPDYARKNTPRRSTRTWKTSKAPRRLDGLFPGRTSRPLDAALREYLAHPEGDACKWVFSRPGFWPGSRPLDCRSGCIC